MKNEVLIVLGSPNAPSGKLSKISICRLDCCANLYSKGKLILCTGGWGKHFNTSNEAHAAYAKKYLIEKGVSESDFLDFALSENTVDDAVKVKQIISKFADFQLTIISSDYHIERVKLIFQEVIINHNINYIGVQCDIDKRQLQDLIRHEHEAINSIIKNGLYY